MTYRYGFNYYTSLERLQAWCESHGFHYSCGIDYGHDYDWVITIFEEDE